MRNAVLALVTLAALGACDGPSPSGQPASAGGDTALKSAAERECAQMTGYEPDKLATATTELRALIEREFKSCVEKVTGPS